MHCMTVEPLYDDSYEKVINTVEQWSKEHPRKTRQSVFLEQWPNACVDSNGVLTICPMAVSADYRTKTGECKHPDVKCFECEYKFWMQEA